MNGTSVVEGIGTFTYRVVPLLVEYHRKFSTVLEQLKGFADKSAHEKYYYTNRTDAIRAEVAAIEEWHMRVAPAARRLAQEVSGMIDQGRLSSLEKTELQLRLAEFEAALQSLPELLKVYRASGKRSSGWIGGLWAFVC